MPTIDEEIDEFEGRRITPWERRGMYRGAYIAWAATNERLQREHEEGLPSRQLRPPAEQVSMFVKAMLIILMVTVVPFAIDYYLLLPKNWVGSDRILVSVVAIPIALIFIEGPIFMAGVFLLGGLAEAWNAIRYTSKKRE